MIEQKEIVVAVSGGFDPIHIGHLRMFQDAKKLGNKLVVILNCDQWLIRKKGNYFMPVAERAEIIKGFSCVDDVYIHESDSNDVCDALQKIKPNIFANGGDRKNDNDVPETEVCKKFNIKTVYNIGGSKIQSSSELVENFFRNMV
ncbi:MAG: adenylyltransferase/cytidyltransferase family protein [Candidatus Falkowbacteria bacterium]